MSQDNAIVVGGGPTGLLAALGLARAGVEVTLLEAEPGIMPSPRAMVYHAAVLPGLETLGVLADAEAIGCRGVSLQMHVFATGERIEFDMRDVAGQKRGYNLHLGQNKLADVALQHLLKHPNARVINNARVIGLAQGANGVSVQAETPDGVKTLRAGWVVGADGARSGVREALGLELEGTTWPERFVATNVRCNFDELGYADATMQIDPRYGAIVARIDKTGLWRCTYSEDAALPEEGILDRMKAWYAAVLPAGAKWELVQHSPYRMHQRAVSQMRVGRVLLAGDAAHITNPTGGLGLTSGLFDLYVLYPALAAVIRGEADEKVLDTWAAERLQAFKERASPAASEFKRMVYSSTEPERLEGQLQGLRELVKNVPAQRQAFGVASSLETPSVLGRA
ncbi:MAG TPA: FAD-dependent monooxygenase, partial [Ramlibacter sp.]|nr:FAD-dependent monooxygenase [Ramlibacter sp.]